VGAYRHNAWLKDGSARTLREAIVAAAEWSGVTDLTDDEYDSLERYLQELTDRDFFVLNSNPSSGDVELGVDDTITMTFNQPVWSGSENLSRFQLLDADGGSIAVDVELDNRTVSLTPSSTLEWASSYQVVVEAGLESFDERVIDDAIRIDVATANSPEVWFDGPYELLVELPAFDFEADGLNPDTTLAIINTFVAEPTVSGSLISMELNEGLTWDTTAVINDTQFTIPPLPIKAANSLAQGSDISGEAVDTDGDGVVDQASGTFTVSGPGFFAENVEWEISAATATADCVLGAEGAVDVTVEVDDGDVVIDWGETEALGLYVTTYGASLPLGPGTVVSGGDAFWAVSTESFPQGFAGPAVYGELPDLAVDESEANGAPAGGAELVAGECYQFSVITTAFQMGSFTIVL
jgi:hypothetical protein